MARSHVPSAADLSDPSTGTFYDFLEFTVTNPNSPLRRLYPNNLAPPPSIDIDTSLVDSICIPMRLQLFKDAAATLPYMMFPFHKKRGGGGGVRGTLTTGSKTTPARHEPQRPGQKTRCFIRVNR